MALPAPAYPRRFLRKHYTPGQRSVLLEIANEAIRRYGAPGSAGGRRIVKPERRKIRSAYQTGRPESNYMNLSGGDRDSAGWRQERRMYYDDPTNLPASVKRYFNETDAAYRGQTSAALSQDVQRSGYPGRYAEARAEGQRLLRRLVLDPNAARRKGGGHGGGGASAKAAGTPDSLKALIGGGTQNTPVAGSAPPDPEFSARINLKLPELAGDVPASDVPTRETGGVDLAALRRTLSSAPMTSPVPVPFGGTLGGKVPAGGITFRTGRGRPVPLNPARFQVGKSGRTAVLRRGPHEGEVVAWQGGAWRFARGGRPVRGLNWRPQGAQHSLVNAMFKAPKGEVIGSPIDRPGVRTAPIVRHFVRRLAGSLGSPVQSGTGSAHSQMTASGNVSDHWGGRAEDLPATGTRLKHYGSHALRLVGVGRARARQMAAQGGIFNITYKGHRFQIIVRAPDHWDHLHVGIQ